MCYKIFVFLVVAVTVFGEIEENWPVKYSTDITKISMTDGVVQKLKVWKTKGRSRIDYNDGAVISFVVAVNVSYNVGFDVHAVTTENGINTMVCKKLDEKLDFNILPRLYDDYKFKGKDILREGNVSKYYYEDEEDSSKTYNTLNVVLNENSTLVPIRFETIKYNTWTKGVRSHKIWEFHNFQLDFDEKVLNYSQYNCTEKLSYTLEGEEVAESLLLMDPKTKLDHTFEAFKKKHGKVYSDYKEEAIRKSIFKKNMRLVIATNRKNLGYKLSINKFADRTPQEMKRYRGLKRSNKNEVGTISFPYTEMQLKEMAQNLPKNYDARNYGLVTPVQDQGSCDCSWAIASTSAVEGALARVNGGRLLILSKQALVDCNWSSLNKGCNGGSYGDAYKWIAKHGLPTEEEYGPYQNKEGFCRMENMTEVFKIRGFTKVTPWSVSALKVAVVNHGPLSVTMTAATLLPLYSGGILYDPSCNEETTKHEVVLVGYGEKDGESYWIVKNCWGTNWGMDGYFHITTRDNNCGIATEPSYPMTYYKLKFDEYFFNAMDSDNDSNSYFKAYFHFESGV